MLLKKINAVLSLLTTALILDHAIFFSVWMLMRGGIPKSAEQLPWILAAFAGVHAVLSVALMIKDGRGKKRGLKAYPRLNASTYIQRASGVLILLLTFLHVAGAANYFQPKMLHAVLHPVFFAVALAHVAFSLDRAMITLGIGSERVARIVGIITKIVCAATFVAGSIGFYLCLFVGVVK